MSMEGLEEGPRRQNAGKNDGIGFTPSLELHSDSGYLAALVSFDHCVVDELRNQRK